MAKVKNNKSRIFIALAVVCTVAAAAAGAWILSQRKKMNPAPEVTSPKYELWKISLTGISDHTKCSGTFAQTIDIDLLYSESLSKILAKIPSAEPVTISAKSILSASENVKVQSKKPHEKLVPSETRGLKAEALTSWMLDKGQSLLRVAVSSANPLVVGNCVRNEETIANNQRAIFLYGTKFGNNAIEGTWSTFEGGEAKGTFVQQWVAGGESKISLPPVFDVQAIAGTGNVTLKWRHFPGADGYKIYVLKGTKISPENVIKTQIAQDNLSIVTDLDQNLTYTFVVATIFKDAEGQGSQPVFAKASQAVIATEVAAGDRHACAIISTGQVLCWGANEKGQVDEGHPTTWSFPVLMPKIIQAKKISARGNYTCVENRDGSQKCWGEQTSVQSKSAPPKPQLDKISKIESGNGFACAQLQDNSLRCWGKNNLGQLATGDYVSRSEPIEPASFVSDKLKPGRLALGDSFGCVINQADNVLCWGANDVGQLGNGSNGSSNIPQAVRK